MFNLEDEMLALDASGDDALIFFPKDSGLDDKFCYEGADAIIRRLKADSDNEWSFHTVANINDSFVTITNTYGDLNTVARAAQYQFGAISDVRDLSNVKYQDSNFPKSLIPHIA